MEATTKYLIIGGGVASAHAAVAIRERDSEGSLTILCGENHFPYDRPPLSKNFLTNDAMTAEDPESKDPSYYTDKNITVRRGAIVQKVNREDRLVTLTDGSKIGYEKLLLTTGASPHMLSVPGDDLGNVFFLRSVDDAEEIRQALRNAKTAVMVGAGYIGLEVAAAATARGVECTVIGKSAYPWDRFASPETGAFVRRRFEEKGVRFLLGEEVARFEGEAAVEAVHTKSDVRVAADMVVIGVGVKLRTDLAIEAGLEVGDHEAVLVDEHLRTSDPHIYAAGDIASFLDPYSGRRRHAEHYLNGKWQGRSAGANMAGDPKPFTDVAYFFSDMFDIHMALRGDPDAGQPGKVLGDRSAGEFVELYAHPDGRLAAGMVVSKDESALDPISDKLEELIKSAALVDDVDKAALGYSPVLA